VLFLLVFATPVLSPVYTSQAQYSLTAVRMDNPGEANIPSLPQTYLSPLINPGVTPQAYLEDACRAVQQRWAPLSSRPGTVVLPVMFHHIYKNGWNVRHSQEISERVFLNFVERAHELGFETITTAQLSDFLEHNASIPPRSMILILDDRRLKVVREYFLPLWEEYNWTVTLAYISGPEVTSKEWEEIEGLTASGAVEVQAHGYLHNEQSYVRDQTPEDVILQEINVPTIILESHSGRKPQAIIWPGGHFNAFGVTAARQAGYQLGFTVYSRGPLMFNWIPLGEAEQAVGDPLMVLPRGWSSEAIQKLEMAAQIGEQARLHAERNFEQEARWYREVCRGELTPPSRARQGLAVE
jgi:peptidoglycan/xylan/chitin deacetylase (PgdA/CDA1 family)